MTRAVKQLAAGDAPFRGFGLRVVPDRGVDDGLHHPHRPADQPTVVGMDVYDAK